MLGRAYEQLADWRGADAEYERTLKELPGAPFAYNPAILVLNQFRLARIYDKLDDTDRARHWYERFTEDWKDADPDIPELIEARERLAELRAGEAAAE